MIYLKAQGRLGNQMFQYAFVKYLKKIYAQDIFITFDRVRKKSKHIGDGWDNGLINFNAQDYTEIFYSQKQYLWVWIKLKLVRRIIQLKKDKFNYNGHGEEFGVIYCYEPCDIKFLNIKRKNIIVDGLFEYSYIVDKVIQEMRNEFCQNIHVRKENQELYEKVLKSNSICVTVRKFDMENPKFTSFYQMCSIEYYYRGIRYILEKHPDSNIIVFSDQIEWCKNNLKLESVFPGVLISYETEGNSLCEKIQFMTRCTHFVISNSTFSWWAQRLAEDKKNGIQKIVCAPIQWNQDYYTKEIGLYCENWVLLEN